MSQFTKKMIFIVDNIYVSPSCPKSLEALAVEVCKTTHHAFVDGESLDRLEKGMQVYVNRAGSRRGAPLKMYHSHYEGAGQFTIRRSDANGNDFIRLHYFKLEGHIHVSEDGMTVYQQKFLEESEEGGDHV